jgi:hypothetical protein
LSVVIKYGNHFILLREILSLDAHAGLAGIMHFANRLRRESYCAEKSEILGTLCTMPGQRRILRRDDRSVAFSLFFSPRTDRQTDGERSYISRVQAGNMCFYRQLGHAGSQASRRKVSLAAAIIRLYQSTFRLGCVARPPPYNFRPLP